MIKDIFQISVPILVALVSSLVAYLKAVKDSKLKIKELEMKHVHEIDKLNKEMEMQIKLYESQKQTDLVDAFFKGETDFEKVTKSLESFVALAEQIEKFEKKIPKQFTTKR